jgi:dTDP-glucose 4,6-dehydratase
MDNPLVADLDQVVVGARAAWDALSGQRIFVTGGTGFFGSWLLESFAWANDRLKLSAEMVVLTRDPEGFARKAPHLARHPAIRFHAGDVRSFAFPGGPFAHVIHAATEASAALNLQAPQEMLATILEGTRRTLEFARHAGTRRFLFTSSGAVYGPQPPLLSRLPENYPGRPDPADPRSAYGQGKRLAEELCAHQARETGLEVAFARCFAFVGPYLPLDRHFAIGNFLRDALAGGPIQVNGDGTPYRSYLYAADLAIWLWTILVRGVSCRPYNVGSGRAVTIAETAAAVAQACEPPCEVRIAGTPVPDQLAERYVPSVARAGAELGLRQTIDLPVAIKRTLSWLRANFDTERGPPRDPQDA